MMYYVVGNGAVVSATQYKSGWKAFLTANRQYATGLSYKHAIAYAHISGNCTVINEHEFKNYKLEGEKD